MGRTLETLRVKLHRNDPALFNMQGLSWIIWGAAEATRAGIPSADEVGRAAAALLKANFVDAVLVT